MSMIPLALKGASLNPASLSGVAGLAVTLRAWRESRRRTLALSALDDRTLMDIGLHRSEIASVVSLPHDPTRHHR